MKDVDYVLFSDSAVKAATNDQQWYVTISCGRKGVTVFTADKIQLRQNITHSGDRDLALDIAKPEGAVPYHHLEFAKFESGEAVETLTITFLKHQVRIAGRNLRQLAVGVQGRAVEWLKPVPERYAAVAGTEACTIESIGIE